MSIIFIFLFMLKVVITPSLSFVSVVTNQNLEVYTRFIDISYELNG